MKYSASYMQGGIETRYYLGEFKSWNLALKAALKEEMFKGILVSLQIK